MLIILIAVVYSTYCNLVAQTIHTNRLPMNNVRIKLAFDKLLSAK